MNAVINPPLPSFKATLRTQGLALPRLSLEILQVNVGKLCNQACHHCHVDAGPKRTEIMDECTATRVIELMHGTASVHTVDITGGAPELNAQFRPLVVAARAAGKNVIDRCNLTVLFEPGQEDTAEFLAAQRVTIIASLPCYSKANVEKQRGLGVFDKSIDALRKLNALGYGQPDSGLELHLVYNPVGAYLPGSQVRLEADYKRELSEHFDIVFNHLYTITNMPISRFLHALQRDGEYAQYMGKLLDAFNPQAALGVMCRNLVSVSWDGVLYDCDFNQMLELPLAHKSRTIWDIESLAEIEREPIVFGAHCYGCTAGAGSSCGGSLA
jgi:radical SAM/Cys-rich protein